MKRSLKGKRHARPGILMRAAAVAFAAFSACHPTPDRVNPQAPQTENPVSLGNFLKFIMEPTQYGFIYPNRFATYFCSEAGKGRYFFEENLGEELKNTGGSRRSARIVLSCFGDESYYLVTEEEEMRVRRRKEHGLEILSADERIYDDVHLGVGRTLNPVSMDSIADILKGKRVAVFGEVHPWMRDGKRFAQLIPTLKMAGFGHVGLEHIKESEQYYRRYVKNPNERNLRAIFYILSALKVGTYLVEYVDLGNEKPWSFVSDEQLLINKALAKARMEVFCFDFPLEKERVFYRDRIRERYMADQITKVVDKGHRVAIFTGSTHALNLGGQTSIGFMGQQLKIVSDMGYKEVTKILKERYGNDKVVSIDLSGCYTPYIDYCVR